MLATSVPMLSIMPTSSPHPPADVRGVEGCGSVFTKGMFIISWISSVWEGWYTGWLGVGAAGTDRGRLGVRTASGALVGGRGLEIGDVGSGFVVKFVEELF